MNIVIDNYAAIDLQSNPIISKFFKGMIPQKAVGFGQNLLIIGIGVANKLLINNSPEEAYKKLNKMAQNVTYEYQNQSNNKYGSSPNKIQIEQNIQQPKYKNKSRKKQFERNQQQHQIEFNENVQQDDKQKQRLKQEINQVKRQLDSLNSKLEQQQNAQNQQNPRVIPNHYDTVPDEFYQQSNSRGRSKQYQQNQKITPKITESPPPPQQMVIIRSGLKPHLNDNAIKQCMQIQDLDDDYGNGGHQNARMNYPQSQQNNQPYISARNQQFMRSSGMNNDYDMSSSKGMQQQRSNERLSDAYFNSESNFRQKKEKQNQNNNKQRNAKKNNNNLKSSPLRRNPSQQLGTVRSDKKNPYQNVESRIKGEIQADKQQHQNNPNQQQQQEQDQENEIDDFKHQMSEGYQQQQNSDGEEDNKNNQEEGKNKDNIVKELGVVYSKTAQKRFYERQEAEKKKKEQQKQIGQERKNAQQQLQQQGQQQMQNYSVQYSPQQQEQYYRNMVAASSLSPSQQNFQQQSYPAYNYNQQQNYPQSGYPQSGYPQSSYPQSNYPQSSYLNAIGNDSNRMMMNSHPENFGRGAINSQKNTMYGGQQGGNNNYAKKNILDIANSFLSSPLMHQFNEDDYYNDEEYQYDDTYQMNQREEVNEYEDFQYPQGSPMNDTNQQQQLNNPMKISYINPSNPYNNSLMVDPQRQITGSRVGFNYSMQKKFPTNDSKYLNIQ